MFPGNEHEQRDNPSFLKAALEGGLIETAEHKVSEFMHSPSTTSHWQAFKRILRYLKVPGIRASLLDEQ
jgi:hypothetical protein